MAGTRERLLGRIRDAVQSGVGSDVDVHLFGSWARGDEWPSSDVDVALDGHGRAVDERCLARLRERLEEAPIPVRVDLVDLARLGPALGRRIRAQAIAWPG